MQVSSQTNNHQAAILPVVPERPEKPTEPEVELSPEDELNQDREAQAAKDAETALSQEKQDAQREYAAGYVAHQSKQTQAEIYLSVATQSDVDLGNNTANVVETLRDVQKQNSNVEAYATYQENQNDGKGILY